MVSRRQTRRLNLTHAHNIFFDKIPSRHETVCMCPIVGPVSPVFLGPVVPTRPTIVPSSWNAHSIM